MSKILKPPSSKTPYHSPDSEFILNANEGGPATPEGVLFVDAKSSPAGKSLLIVNSEGDGVVKIFTPKI
ncbi:hypothetical protein [Chitinophaga sp.]|uniref:hypothetical protein n=1 Tax=Chitinophaga sp. TaxID=1869181 RepID=UPI0026294197|nr:hypothetical protein [uncultured Chitinophaga sp.]